MKDQSAPRERPILFSGPLVRALLEGRKTVTRRAVSIQPSSRADIGSYGVGQPFIRNPNSAKKNLECPYGQPGDRLWVREAWAKTRVYQAGGEEWFVYREGDNRTDYGGPWKPSIHMPRVASRILLEVTDVRVERLHAVSEAQAMAEGITQFKPADKDGMRHFGLADGQGEGEPTAAHAFKALWESINGPDSWASNPWVWCVEFRRVTP
ncbi:hypothetical protein [Azotobacter chroococcum]|uniref:hypothetical protein n=1 Tax=Azotobacter chroococcum TaxID=353 RepID=UPI0031019AF0